MRKKLYLITLIAFGGFHLNAQNQKCSAMDIYNKRAINNPELVAKRAQLETQTQNWINANSDAPKTRNIITIPVVFHVIYKTAGQNVSDAQIETQLATLNEDFRLFNTDSLTDFHPFWEFTADTQIEFCLAQRDPQGNATTGITRTLTTVNAFTGEDGAEKRTASGGKDNWDPTKYLNIWVCDLSAGQGLLGYATFPSDLADWPEDDGVVINYTAFGSIGTASAPNDLGRTGTHEVGHWLNLSHIWGDAECGDDLVDDTEVAFESNFGCPTFPHNANSSCGSGASGEMYMNYMDYVDDACMVMFTLGQGNRMRAALNGPRSGLLTSNGCDPIGASVTEEFTSNFMISPNPSNGKFVVNASNSTKATISIYSIIGEKVLVFDQVKTFPFEINTKDLSNGTYFVNFQEGNTSVTEKIIISK